ncbi:MAG: Spy/CpxP family protein refolding chaperone [Gemmatimonadetes bacterium]|nr:Spy/CpxP family protein refolding chaperone [Gemmatimonadota bacterium]
MNVRRWARGLIIAAGVALASAPAGWAQGPVPPAPPVPPGPGMQPGGPGMPDMPGMRGMMRRMQIRPGQTGPRAAVGAPAEAILRARERLSLTDEQVTRLQALAESQREALQPPTADLMRARADLLEATQGNIDLNAARVALDRLSRLRNDATLARLRARQEALNVLTPEQRSQLESAGPQRFERRGFAPSPDRLRRPGFAPGPRFRRR